MRLEAGSQGIQLTFYVYEHWRHDTDVCFYVGKGHGRRSNLMAARNSHHVNIQRKLAGLGMRVEVRLVQSGLTESEAFTIERERIAFWKSAGVRLSNKSDGGEGPSGAIFSSETKARLRAKRKLRVFTQSDRTAMSNGRIGMKFSAKHRAALAANKMGRSRKPFTRETLDLMRTAAIAREQAKRDRFGDHVRRTSRLLEPA